MSGRYRQVSNVTFRDVNITIDAWSNYSNPVHDYRPAWFNPAWIYCRECCAVVQRPGFRLRASRVRCAVPVQNLLRPHTRYQLLTSTLIAFATHAGTDAIYAENTTGFHMDHVAVAFVAAHARPYWARCFNATPADGVTDVTFSNGFSCTPPPAAAHVHASADGA